jgi:hypothetical protein
MRLENYLLVTFIKWRKNEKAKVTKPEGFSGVLYMLNTFTVMWKRGRTLLVSFSKYKIHTHTTTTGLA